MQKRGKKRIAVRDIAYIALFIALIALCSWITIPLTVPITLQTFAVFVTVGLLGWRRGFLAVLLYLLLGAIGIPVFSGFSGGAGVLLGATGGYLIGFLFTALLTGLLIDRFGRRVFVMAVAMLAGLLVCYAFGTVWFMVVYASTSGAVGLGMALSWCVVPFLIPDAVKIALAILTVNRLCKYVTV